MTNSKHTPGPWRFHVPYAGFSKITGANGELVFGIAAGHADEKRPDDECEANAHLISAAPDLLAALYRARERMFGGSPAIRALIAQTDAAIAKATGTHINPTGPSLLEALRGSLGEK